MLGLVVDRSRLVVDRGRLVVDRGRLVVDRGGSGVVDRGGLVVGRSSGGVVGSSSHWGLTLGTVAVGGGTQGHLVASQVKEVAQLELC